MSAQITTAMVNQFSANIYHLAQQKESRILPFIGRKEKQNSEISFYDRIGSVEPMEKVTRHADTTYGEVPYSRRALSMRTWFFADLCDDEDKIKIIHTPESEYAKAASMSLARQIDTVIIDAALGNAYTGKAGTTPVALANANKVAAFDGTATTGSSLTVKTLRAVKKLFKKNEIEEGLYMVVSADELDNMLGTTEITSADYNTVRALVNGEVDSFMGFKFIHSERLPLTTGTTTYNKDTGVVGTGSQTIAAGARRCFAFAGSGMIFATGISMETKIDKLPTKHYSTQVYARMMVGALRMEEVKVVEVICKVA